MKIAIVGLGLLGSSMAKALKGSATIIGIDKDRSVVDHAISDGVITQGGNDLSLVSGCDMVVVALPVGSVVEVVQRLLPHMDKGTVVTDTGSTKAEIVRSINPLWPWFIGSHPMAGKETSGYTLSDMALFKNTVSIITPTPTSKESCIKKVEKVWEMCKARPIFMEPEEHDEIMSRISHFPHLLSFVFMHLVKEKNIHPSLIGKGFKDFSRIAGSDPIMWRDIFMVNSHNILPLIDDYIKELTKVKSYIRKGQAGKLEEALRGYSEIRRSLYEHKG